LIEGRGVAAALRTMVWWLMKEINARSATDVSITAAARVRVRVVKFNQTIFTNIPSINLSNIYFTKSINAIYVNNSKDNLMF
jgi:hypothetical protein